MARKKKPTEWCVATYGSKTNKVLGDFLQGAGYRAEVRDNLGRLHKVWVCPSYDAVRHLNKSRKDLELDYRVFSRPEGAQIVREAHFQKKWSRPVPRKIARAA